MTTATSLFAPRDIAPRLGTCTEYVNNLSCSGQARTGSDVSTAALYWRQIRGSGGTAVGIAWREFVLVLQKHGIL